MKYFIYIITILFAIHVHADSATHQVGTVTRLNGDVRIERIDASIVHATVNMSILNQDKIITAKNSSISITLIDDTRLSIGPESQTHMKNIVFDLESLEGNILIQIYRGSMRMITGLIAQKNQKAVKVVTPTAVVGIRGTDFIVEVKP